MGWVTGDAPTQAELESCVQCGLCLPHCPTFRLTGRETESPRGRLAAMSAVAAGEVPVDAAFERIMDSCLQCRACEPVCPSLVPFGRAMEGARVELAAQLPRPGRRLRRLALGRGLAHVKLVAGVGSVARLARRAPFRLILPSSIHTSVQGLRPDNHSGPVRGQVFAAIGPRFGRAALLSGCVMDAWFGDVHHATIQTLRRAGFDVTVPDRQTCCGALAAHDGDARSARRFARTNVAAFSGFDVVAINSAGCGAHLKEYGNWAGASGSELAGRTHDITELVADAIEDGRLPVATLNRGPVALHDPCHLRHAQRVVEQPRVVVRAAGFTPIDVDSSGTCCGAAGIYSVLHPERSAQLGIRKRNEVAATGSTLVASGNPGCEMQLRAHLEKYYEVVHPVELYWRALAETVEVDSAVSG